MVQTSPILIENLENEFIPPIEAREAWGMSWERQLEIVEAWQEAGGNADGEAGQWADPSVEMIVPALEDAGATNRYGRSGGSGAGGPELTMRTIVRMNTLLVSLRERLLQITTEASNVAIAEMALRQGAATEVAGTPDASGPQPPLHEENARHLEALVRSWFEVTAAAQNSMTALTGVAPAGAAGERRAVAEEGSPLKERRHRAVAIDFPDRRRAVG